MLSFQRLARSSDSLFKALTGLWRGEFERLLPAFQVALDQYDQQQAERPNRQRAPGAGGSPSLGDAYNQLLFILVYVKQYPTQDLQAILFGKTQAWAFKWIHRLLPLLEQALGEKQQLPLRRLTSVDELRERCPEMEFIIDGTERPVGRPTKEPTQTQKYSGKKKRHTVKNILVTSKKTKRILVLGPTEMGSKHDKKMLDDSGIAFPVGSRLFQDSGFQGYRPDGIDVHQPTKKPRQGELTDEQKALNHAISRERIGVEHSIGGAKISRITRDVLRNRRSDVPDRAMNVACGLHNYRIAYGARVAV